MVGLLGTTTQPLVLANWPDQFFAKENLWRLPRSTCDNYCVKNQRDGSVEYYHQPLCAVLVHPERREVLPVVPPGPILKRTARRKNDYGRKRAEARRRSVC